MKKLISSVPFILLLSAFVAAEPKFGRSGGYSRSSPSHSYSSSRHSSPSYSSPSHSSPSHSSPSHSSPSHSSPSHHAVSSPAISHSYPVHSGSSGISRPATNTHVSSGGSHSYPTSGSGMSGGNKPNTPFTGTAVGGHSSPTGPISSVSFKPSNSQPTHGGSHISNTGSHGYPASNGGLSGHATNVRPVQNQPFHGTPVGGQPAYPTSNGLSGNSRYPNTGNANTAHVQPTYNQPMHSQPNTRYVAPAYGHAYSGTGYHAVPVVPVTYGVHGPVYTTASAGYHPTFVTYSTHSSGSDLNSMLTGLALYNALRSGHSHDHYYHHHGYGYGHGNTQNTYNNYYSNTSDPNSRPVSPSQTSSNTASVPSAVGLTNCTLSLSNFNGTDTITIPCEIASSFAVQNTSAPLPPPTSDTKLNCTIAVVKNNGLTEFTQIPCDMITNMAPKPEPSSLRLNCTQGQDIAYGGNPCSILPSSPDAFPLEVIPLDIKPDSPKGPEISNPSINPKPLQIGSDKSAAAAA